MKARGLTGALLALAAWVLTAGTAVGATGSISGTVTDSSHAPVSGISVCGTSRDFAGPWAGCDFTDADGEYEIEDVEPSFYVIYFTDGQPNRNYVSEFWDDKPSRETADSVEVTSGAAVTGIDAELATGGQITGRLTDAATGLPIESVFACAANVVPQEETNCGRTDANGEYVVNSLATGTYEVEFFVDESPNYIPQYWHGKATRAEADTVSVTAGSITPNIDDELHEGLQITGTLTEAGTGLPLKWIRLCVLDAGTEAERGCWYSGEDGTYSIAGLPLGTYVVSFAVDYKEEGVLLYSDGYVRQYYNGRPTFASADPVVGAIPGLISGIDAQLVQGPELWPDLPLGQPPGETPLVTPPPVTQLPTPAQQAPPRRCRKGFHKKKVKGHYRCVRKKHRRHGHRRHR